MFLLVSLCNVYVHYYLQHTKIFKGCPPSEAATFVLTFLKSYIQIMAKYQSIVIKQSSIKMVQALTDDTYTGHSGKAYILYGVHTRME